MSPPPFRLLALLACAFLASACATPLQLPAIPEAPSGESQPGKFIWMDLVTDQVPEAKAFYGELFGWEFAASGVDVDYTEIRSGGRTIGGIARIDPGQHESAWVATLSVRDVDVATALVRDQGGTVYEGPVEAGARGRFSLVGDPDGAILALLRAPGGDPPDRVIPPGDFLWLELWTRDVDEALDFYGSLAGWESDIIDFRGQPYHLLKIGPKARAGIIRMPWEEVPSTWLPYVRVEDPEAIVERAFALGGQLVIRDPDAAILLDPVGGAFGIQKWDKPQNVAAP